MTRVIINHSIATFSLPYWLKLADIVSIYKRAVHPWQTKLSPNKVIVLNVIDKKTLSSNELSHRISFVMRQVFTEIMNWWMVFAEWLTDERRLHLVSSRDYCQCSLPSQISNTLLAGFKPAQNLSSQTWFNEVVQQS